ncbi:hypothetical protein [Flavobacterium sp. N1736]|uniref:hypothetical protein n=1 Tax=Flavobacterium sp. N1736 TaxID=2986823 RepID=UPI00222450CA|nr:hypothetical protein [Flavobacterium sp. N1736]
MELSVLQAYNFDYYNVEKANNPDHYFKAVHVYKFNVDENRYMVTVEEYQHHFYVLKFCLENHRDNHDKFNVLINIGHAKARKVLLTCVKIGMSIYEQNPLASFGFIASPTTEELGKTGFNATKRLLVYKHFTESFFHPENFTHSYSQEQSSYLVLNKNYEQQEPNAMQKITEMLKADVARIVNC